MQWLTEHRLVLILSDCLFSGHWWPSYCWWFFSICEKVTSAQLLVAPRRTTSQPAFGADELTRARVFKLATRNRMTLLGALIHLYQGAEASISNYVVSFPIDSSQWRTRDYVMPGWWRNEIWSFPACTTSQELDKLILVNYRPPS